jgi:hypothetical protein
VIPEIVNSSDGEMTRCIAVIGLKSMVHSPKSIFPCGLGITQSRGGWAVHGITATGKKEQVNRNPMLLPLTKNMSFLQNSRS